MPRTLCRFDYFLIEITCSHDWLIESFFFVVSSIIGQRRNDDVLVDWLLLGADHQRRGEFQNYSGKKSVLLLLPDKVDLYELHSRLLIKEINIE